MYPKTQSTNLNQRIQDLYDRSSLLWEKIWGEHMHHGYYGFGEDSRTKDRYQAQVDLISQILTWSGIEQSPPSRILDLGCGIGGSSLHLARLFPQAQITGITLSPVQASRATERALAQSFSDRVQFLVADALAMPFADQSFDLVWSLESGEHMPDKQKFLQACDRVLVPGGQLVLATWCHRPIADRPLTSYEQRHLERIYTAYCLPYVISLPEYTQIMQDLHYQNLQVADWSKQVAPFWDLVISSFLTPSTFAQVLNSGLVTLTAAMSLRLMSRGYASGLVRFGLVSGHKAA
ncbi:MAG: methyltransferase domain-containing protein [Pseudanabaenaceae cyanobacterium bins.68]|nr:methyltransferase domain-containing protein [Pseudanabaenaceae cyanobacterium bins.68]